MVLTNIPNHYRIPLFNELKGQLNAKDTELVVLFAAESYGRRRAVGREHKLDEAAFEWSILPSLILGKHRPLFIPKGLTRILDEYQPSAILVGGIGTLAVAAYRAARRHGVPFLVWSGEIESRTGPASFFKRPIKSRLLRRASGVVVYGSLAADFARSLAPDSAIYTGWNTVDIAPLLGIDRSDGLAGSPTRLVAVGDLVAYKGYDRLVEALARLRTAGLEFELTIVGEGRERKRLAALTDRYEMSELVHLVGMKSRKELPSVLSEGDAFVFPSLGEPWGLALVEGMAAGLPVVASSRAGAAHDLVVPGTGFTADPLNVSELSDALAAMLLLSDGERHDMGMRARSHVAQLCSLENSASGFVTAFESALSALAPSA